MNNNVYPNNIQPGTTTIPELNNVNYNTMQGSCIVDTQSSQQQLVSLDHSEVNTQIVSLDNRVDRSHDCNYVEKYRVRNFNEMLGNEDAKATLLGEVIHNYYQNVKILHGPPSSGKTSAATIQAKLINCKSPKDVGVPCEKCSSCTSFAAKANNDIIVINAGSNNGVETSRDIEERLRTAPLYNKKVVILEEWQKMSPQALTALLTVMENPTISADTAKASDYVFLMPTTELPTDISDNAILSRAVVVNFFAVPKNLVINRLAEICALEDITIEEGVLDILYHNSNGAMRDCLKNLQTLATRSNFNITVESIKGFFALGASDLAKSLFASIHSLNPVNVNNLIESHSNKTVLKEFDFNDLAEIFIQAAHNATPFMHKVYTKCLGVLRDNRTKFLRDPSRRVQDNLIIACNDILATLRDNLGLAICNQIKEVDNNIGNSLLSLNPNIKINNNQLIFTIDPPNLGIGTLISDINRPDLREIFRFFNISNFEFNNIGRNICYKVATEFDRNFADTLINLNPTTMVDNKQLVLVLNQPTVDLDDFTVKINSEQVNSIFNSFGISRYIINSIPNNQVNYVNNNQVNHVNNNQINPANNVQVNNIAENICNQIATIENFEPFADFLRTLNPIVSSDADNRLIFSIDKPTAYSDGSPINWDHFNSFFFYPGVSAILKENGIAEQQYR